MNSISGIWQQWVIENTSLGVPSEVIEETLDRHGFSTRAIRRALRALDDGAARTALESAQRKTEKLAWILSLYEKCADVAPETRAIERVEKATREQFFAEYYARNRPVILSKMLGAWAAPKYWSRKRLARELGSHQIEVQAGRDADPNYEIRSVAHKSRTSFGAFLNRTFSGPDGNDTYLTANNAAGSPEFIREILRTVTLPSTLCDDARREGRLFLWMGPRGTVTPLHHDLTNNGMAQIVGRKRVKLISPNYTPRLYNTRHCFSPVDPENLDYTRFPKTAGIRIEEVILEPGEVLFIPVGWWHHVRALDPSITVSFTNFHADNTFSAGYERLMESL